MEELKRLPNGYRPQLTEAKKRLKHLLAEISVLKGAGGYAQSLQTKLSSLAMHVHIISEQKTSDGLSLQIKWGVITTIIFVDTKTEKFRIGSVCEVAIPNTNQFVTNCKW